MPPRKKKEQLDLPIDLKTEKKAPKPAKTSKKMKIEAGTEPTLQDEARQLIQDLKKEKSEHETPAAKNPIESHKTEPPRPPEYRRTWPWVLISTLAVLALIAIGFLIYFKLNEGKPLSKYLPADATLGFMTLSLNPSGNDYRELDRLFQASGSGSLIEQTFKMKDQDFQNAVVSWLGQKQALALLLSPKGIPVPVLFVPFSNREKAIQFFSRFADKDLTLSGDRKFFELAKLNSFLAIVDNYILIAADQDVLQKIIDTAGGTSQSLYGDQNLIEVEKNLPASPFIFVYANISKVFPLLKENFILRDSFGDWGILLDPVAKNIRSVGIAFDLKQDTDRTALYSKTFVLGDRSFFSAFKEMLAATSVFDTKNTENTIAYIGGINFLEQANAFVRSVGNTSVDAEIVLEGLANYAIQKYISSNLDMQKLSQMSIGEYAFFLNKLNDSQGGVGWLGIFHLKNEADTARLMDQIFGDFRNQSALLYDPRIRPVTLPDGTVGKEVYTAPKDITIKTEELQGATMHYLEISDETFSPGYLIVDGNLYLFSHVALMRQYNDAKKSVPQPLNNILYYKGTKGMFDLSLLLPKVPGYNAIPLPLQKSFQKLGKNLWSFSFFDQGMVLENVTEIKN